MAKKTPRTRGHVADWTDDFDLALENAGKALNRPPYIVDAAVYVRDTLNLAWKAAESVFDKRATPEIALAIYDRINADRLRRESGDVDSEPT